MFFFSWLQLTAFCYLISALFSPPSLFGSAVLPWWSWGLFIAWSYLWNKWLHQRQYPLAVWASMQFVFFAVFGAGALGWLQYILSGAFWPNSLINIFLASAIFLSLSYSFLKPLTEKLRSELWELGIILSSCAAILVSSYRLDIPFAPAVPIVMIVCGIFRLGLTPREESGEVIRSAKTSRIPMGLALVSLTLGIAIFSLIGLAADNSIGQAINTLLKAIIEFYQQIGPETLDKAARAIPFVDLDYTKLMESTSSSGVQAPLWFMIILWFILAVSILLTIIAFILYAALKINEFRRTLKTRQFVPVAGNQFRAAWMKAVAGFLRSLPAGLSYLGCLFRDLWRLTAFRIGICPKDIKGLCSYFIWWGAGLGVRRNKHQTLREYREGLAQSIGSFPPGLMADLERLTVGYERYCYGGDLAPLTIKDMKDIFTALTNYRKARKASR